ncbi:uncharacterized protein [Macrobrachium rosenbergii]|uniref:uncharacterized protein n=1 Tax=Macrobrachium rosenbergii TaxID=79674 RepID=UPI0034D5B94C
MWGVRYLPIYLAAVATAQESEGYRVLFVCGVSTKSHYNFYKGIIKELADSGNHVTVITPYASKDERRNGKIREVLVPEADVMRTNPNRFNLTMLTFFHQIQTLIPICVEILGKREVQSLRQEKFDVILLSPFSDCYLSLVHQLQVPLIYVSPFGLTSNLAEVVGNPIFPSCVTMLALDYVHPLTFAQRTKNILAELALTLLFNYYVRPKMEEECHRSGPCSNGTPPFAEIQRNASLLFVNSVRELEIPARPYIASVIHLGGIHCRPAEPLPKDLSDWVEGAGEDGFVFFSLGTAVKSSDLSVSHRKILTKVFGSLKQRVLWKWDDESIPGMPPNVRVAKWLPQQDILGHPKLRLFITHGGLLSTLESVYHGRPVLGMPVFGDQMGNMKEVERQGWGKTVPWNDLTEGGLVEEINSVMNNATMHEIVETRSRLMRDQPMTPKEQLLFWTGYVIRHKGATRLRSPIAQMPWYKVYNVDVWLMVAALCALTTWLFCRISLSVIRFLLRKGKAKETARIMWEARHILLCTAAALLTVQASDGYRVLFMGVLGTKSHTNFYMGIIKELADSGHHVTFVTSYSTKESRTNENIKEVFVPEVDSFHDSLNRFKMSTVALVFKMRDFMPLCLNALRNDKVQGLLREEFDVVLLSPFNDCLLSIVYQLQAPFIYVYPIGMTSYLSSIVGNPDFPSFVSALLFEHSFPLSFWERTLNVLTELGMFLTMTHIFRDKMEQGCRSTGLCQDNMPPFAEIQRNASLVYMNSVRELEIPARPYVPSVIHLGGIHCRPAEPLPKDLNDWAEESGEDGFIFFSLGTAIKSADLPESHRQMLIKTFGSLRQRVLWKWDDESMPGMPPNVRVAKWLPQQDILGHPKLRLFITHGGLLSTLESVYHGRPLLGIPIIADQETNMRDVERQGWGKTLLWEDLTDRRLLEGILSIMNNKTMHEMVQVRSSLMRDQPLTPKEMALFWTEYVIRHKGATHLRSPIAQMPWYQLYNMDVNLTLVTSCVLITWLVCRTLLAVVRFLLRKVKAKQD